MSLLKTDHLVNLGSWKNFAAGTVEGVYPNPVEANTIADLVLFENSSHGYNRVSITLCNSFNSGYIGDNMEYKKATLNKAINEDDFKSSTFSDDQTIKDSECDTGSFCEYNFALTRKYSSDNIYQTKANTLSELLLQMAKDGLKGTVTFHFTPFFRGSIYEPLTLRIVL